VLSFELGPVAQHERAAQAVFGFLLQGRVRQHFRHNDRVAGPRRHLDYADRQILQFSRSPALFAVWLSPNPGTVGPGGLVG